MFLAKRKKFAHVSASVKAENALLFLMSDPEHIGADDIDTAAFHLEDRILPLRGIDTAEMRFTADAVERLAVYRHIIHL